MRLILPKISNQLKECSIYSKWKTFSDLTLSEDLFKSDNILTWILPALITVTYIMFLNASYGCELSPVFLNVDQAYFKSIVHSLEKHWHLFPASLENISNIETPYHHLDSQIKYLFSLIITTNHAIFLANFLIFSFLSYSIFKLDILTTYSLILFIFAFSVLKLPSPNEIIQIIMFPFDFQIKSDLFRNSNTILALGFLTFTWNCRFYLRLLIYLFSFYIKSPAVPAFLAVEIFLIVFSNAQNQKSLTHRILMIVAVILSFLGSYYLFFYNPVDKLLNIIHSKALISFKIRNDIIWFANGKLLYDFILLYLTIRFKIKSKNIILIYLCYLLIILLVIYDSIGLIEINIPNIYQVDFFLRYALLMIILYLNTKIQIKWIGNRLFNGLILCIVIFNCYLFAHFLGALIYNKYDRFSEYVDNSNLIKIISAITDETSVVAFNTVDSPIRKDKQLQLCGIIKNPLWVSNLLYGSVRTRVNAQIDWQILNQALTGTRNFPNNITWLILDKSQNNYKFKDIRKNFTIIKETKTYFLLKRNSTHLRIEKGKSLLQKQS